MTGAYLEPKERLYLLEIGRILFHRTSETLAGSAGMGRRTITMDEAKKNIDGARCDEPRVKRALDRMVNEGALLSEGMGKYITTPEFDRWFEKFKKDYT